VKWGARRLGPYAHDLNRDLAGPQTGSGRRYPSRRPPHFTPSLVLGIRYLAYKVSNLSQDLTVSICYRAFTEPFIRVATLDGLSMVGYVAPI
jgi:hypothetical protein